MNKFCFKHLILFSFLVSAAVTFAEPVKLASVPTPLPNGKQFVFEWNGDIWSSAIKGGKALQLTHHPAKDHWPTVSPDGKQIAFSSKRNDITQVYIMPIGGGTPRQITFHTEGATPLRWFPDGKSLLIRAVRDQVEVGEQSTRFFRVPIDGSGRENLLFNAFGYEADISPDGNKLLFTRDGTKLYRKGYKGSLTAKIWLYNLKSEEFTLLCSDPGGNRSPMWRPDGKAFYFVSQESGCFNVWEKELQSGKKRQLTHFKDNAVILPRLSRNGKTMIFRNLFDFYSFDPTKTKEPVLINLTCNRDRVHATVRRRWYSNIYNNNGDGSLDWTVDGLQMCFTAGGDLWMMDTVLREPVAVTKESGIHETEAVFNPDNDSVYFLRDFGDRVNVWRADKTDTNTFWWQQSSFELSPVTDDESGKYGLSFSPNGSNIAYCVSPGSIMVADIDGSNPREVAKSVFEAGYDWAPDGRHMVCSLSDSDGNRDIWIISTTGEHEPYNLSRHPKWDGNPCWSPDGRKIAFAGRRHDNTYGVYYVYLQKNDEDHSRWDIKLEKALKAMKTDNSKDNDDDKDDAASDKDDSLIIDFDNLHERTHRIAVDSILGEIFWSYDSKALAFQASIGGKSGTWKSIFPDSLNPQLMTTKMGRFSKWIKTGSKIIWKLDNVPAHYTKTFPFSAYQETNVADYQRLTFRQIWRNMRDNFYDEAMNNSDWNSILGKYETMAAEAPNLDIFFRITSMLLGELNASHLGFIETETSKKEWRREWKSRDWGISTAHTGLIFDETDGKPGLIVKHVIENGPADDNASRIFENERVVAIDGTTITTNTAWFRPLTGRFPQKNELSVVDTNGTTRIVTLRTISYDDARKLIREESIKKLNLKVNKLSNAKLGYLHIARMQWEDLYRFEQEVFARGFGKDGLVIDVRANPGGFVADRLLDIFCHPVHAQTIPRGGKISYPLGYLGKAVWSKPIVVLCDQYTGSNGEIFCHAIKSLKRGKLIGVPTQGAVISTPNIRILDMGKLSLPNRGWYVTTDGEDMELNGAKPDVIVHRSPTDVNTAKDPQLEKAVEILLNEITEANKHPRPKLIKARERVKTTD